mgnify:CR=1 FL=1
MFKYFLLLGSLFLSDSILAGTVSHTGTVTDIRVFSLNYGTYDTGGAAMAVFYVSDMQGACGTAEGRVGISSDHPLYQSVLSMVLAAKSNRIKG